MERLDPIQQEDPVQKSQEAKPTDQYSLYQRVKRMTQISMASLGIFITSFETSVFSAEKKFHEREVEMMGQVDISKYSCEIGPEQKESETRYTRYRFGTYEKMDLNELKDSASKRNLNLDTNGMSQKEIDEWYEKACAQMLQVEKDREAIEKLLYQKLNDPRITPIIEEAKKVIGVTKLNNETFFLDIKPVSKDAVPGSNGNAYTDKEGKMFLSSRYIKSLIDPEEKEHASALLTLLNELTHAIRYRQYDDYDEAYKKCVQEGVLPKGYIGEDMLTPESRTLYQEWLKEVYGLEKDNTKFDNLIKTSKESFGKSKDEEIKLMHSKDIEFWQNRKIWNRERYLIEMESFVVPHITIKEIKKTGLHYKIPKNIPFNPAIKRK
jgi:hypothetical protein